MPYQSLLTSEDEPPGKRYIPQPYTAKIVTDIKECQQLWNKFSPQETLYDSWDFRLAFNLAYNFNTHFIVLYHHQIQVGLLPLQYESVKKYYEWFGGYWQEHNNFWVTEERHLPVLMSLIPEPVVLRAINPQQLQQIQNHALLNFEIVSDDPNYSLDLTNLESGQDFLKNLKKKTRYNIKKDWIRISELEPKIIYDRFEDMSVLIELNTQRFLDKGEDPACLDTRHAQALKNVVIFGMESQEFQVRMITIEIENKIAVVDLIAIYKNIYYPLKGGSDLRKFSGIGNFVNLFEINDACEMKMERIDFLQASGGWKTHWFEPKTLMVLKTVGL